MGACASLRISQIEVDCLRTGRFKAVFVDARHGTTRAAHLLCLCVMAEHAPMLGRKVGTVLVMPTWSGRLSNKLIIYAAGAGLIRFVDGRALVRLDSQLRALLPAKYDGDDARVEELPIDDLYDVFLAHTSEANAVWRTGVERSRVALHPLREELVAATWAPQRHVAWCLDTDEQTLLGGLRPPQDPPYDEAGGAKPLAPPTTKLGGGDLLRRSTNPPCRGG
jgi:hypothetical protein